MNIDKLFKEMAFNLEDGEREKEEKEMAKDTKTNSREEPTDENLQS